MTRSPNTSLATLVTASGASHKAIAHRVNQLAAAAGRPTSYTHTSVVNWLEGMIPRGTVPALLAQALGERLGRAVDPAEIAMATPSRDDAGGLELPRDPSNAAQRAADFWRNMHRRSFIKQTFAASAYTVPVTRWLIQPAAGPARGGDGGGGGRRVGQQELTELWEQAEQARQWDARYGGANWRTGQVMDCLTTRAAPLLAGRASKQRIADGLFSAAAELSRLAGWTAFDAGEHAIAQRHFIQALSLARAGGNAELGAYVLATMALQTMRRGYPNEAIDMAQGAYERARDAAHPRVLAFAKLIEARAHARTRDERAAARALSGCERLLDAACEESPTYIAYFGPARMASDAVEIYRDLGKPHVAAGWDAQCAMPAGHTRAVGLRLSVTATAHLQARDLDQGLAVGRRAVDILAGVASARAREYVEDIHTALTPWAREPHVQVWQSRARRQLTGDMGS
ncbi:sporulation protein [Streptomyces sp. NPDC005962]|uniref:sporulation protein n=1 Tax=Streptomyces sp. NPDC005962 TaxID=3154466 RepID=UPI0033E02423